MAHTKGTGFLNVHAFVTRQYGHDAWASLLSGMAEADHRVLEALVPVGWYELTLYARVIRAADERFGAGDLRLVHAIGRFEAERDLTTIHQIFLRLMRPTVAIEQMNKYWRRFHDTGEWETKQGDREANARLTGWGVVDAALCRELVGYLGRTLELVGCRDVHIDHRRCRVRGDASCDFHAAWRLKEDIERQPSKRGTGSMPSTRRSMPSSST